MRLGRLSSTFDLLCNYLRSFIREIEQRADGLTNGTHQPDER